ncbi:MAG: hypothetical protein WCJ97_00495 [Phycisphaerae bacterium]
MSILTKVFIVLQTVFALVLAPLVIVFVGQQDNYKKDVEKANLAKVAAQVQVTKAGKDISALTESFNKLAADNNNQTASLKREVDDRDAKISGLEREKDSFALKASEADIALKQTISSVDALKSLLTSRDKEVSEIRPRLVDLTQKAEDVNRKNGELLIEVEQAKKAIRTLQEALVASQQRGPATGINQAGQQVTQAAAPTIVAPNVVNGRVNQVQELNGKVYLTMSLGGRDGVQNGTKFVISRGSNFVADAVVERVAPDQSVAVVTLSQAAIQVNDVVSSNGL